MGGNRAIRAALLTVILAVQPLSALSVFAQEAQETTTSQSAPAPEADGIGALVAQLETALRAGRPEAFQPFFASPSEELADFVPLMSGPRTNAVVRERDRAEADDGMTATVMLDTFIERGQEGQLTTWAGRMSRASGAWRFTGLRRLSSIDGLYRLTLGTEQFDVQDLTLTGTDLVLRMREGTAFMADVPSGATAIVLRGRGEMVFSPPDEAERAQLRIFADEPVLRAEFREALVRLHPGEMQTRINAGALTPAPTDNDEQRRAQAYFDEHINKTYSLDLQDLSRDRWSLVPTAGDLLAEISTRKHGDLTYAVSDGESEDVSLFQRATRRNISVYASAAKLAERGRFYSEDDLISYDILDHDIDVRMQPARDWIEGTARVRARITTLSTSSLTLRLAEPLVVRSVISRDHGRVMHLRVVNQNNLIVMFPRPVNQGDIVELTVRYGGRLPSQLPDREVIDVALDDDQDFEPIRIPPEPRWIYSNRVYWYPQSTVTDFATARLRITVPEPYDVLATGVQSGSPVAVSALTPEDDPARTFTFQAGMPSRYLSCLISRLAPVSSEPIGGVKLGGIPTMLNVVASPRQADRGGATKRQAERIFGFYQSLLGGAPYPELTVAISESELPGGHSPAYFVILNQTLPGTNLTWRADPVSFNNYPSFFLAHEIAHQWWGQAVGWKNYHEQWISEGFTQYFAALYAGEQDGPDALKSVMRQMRRWALERTAEGPIYLGYRLGHLERDSRAFRAIVYNKSAVVLHMLRAIVGDEPFFRGLQRFYERTKFQKAGTDDFRRVMETESGRNLERFFERWIYGFGVPTVKVTHRVDDNPDGGASVVITAEQQGAIYDLPITVEIEQASGAVRRTVLILDDASVELRVPVEGRVKKVKIDPDEIALARFVR